MHISDWTPPKPAEGGETAISGDIRLQLRKQPPRLRGRFEGAAMLNAPSRNAPNRNSYAERETSMDGLNPIAAVGFSRLQPRDTPRSNFFARTAVIMAIIAAMALLTILALDYVSIHLPTGSDELGWPPFG